MSDQPERHEQLGPQVRLQAEIFKLESHKRELWVLIVFAAAVLFLGVLSLLAPRSFWHLNELEIRISPQIFFVIMLLAVVGGLYAMRRDVEVQKLRLVSLQQLLNARLEQAASMMDGVTNVLGRTFLRELLQGQIAKAERVNRPLALIMSDLDNFKQVNDRYGHLMGDYVLAQMAAILKSCVRGSDFVIRYGGDEFLLILPETDETGANIVKNRIKEKTTEWDRTDRLGEVPITLSLGVYLHVHGQSAEQDVAEADARMYQEKQSARAALASTPS